MKMMKVRDAVKKFIELIEEGKADWDLVAENGEGFEVEDIQIVAVKPKGMEVLFG